MHDRYGMCRVIWAVLCHTIPRIATFFSYRYVPLLITVA